MTFICLILNIFLYPWKRVILMAALTRCTLHQAGWACPLCSCAAGRWSDFAELIIKGARPESRPSNSHTQSLSLQLRAEPWAGWPRAGSQGLTGQRSFLSCSEGRGQDNQDYAVSSVVFKLQSAAPEISLVGCDHHFKWNKNTHKHIEKISDGRKLNKKDICIPTL